MHSLGRALSLGMGPDLAVCGFFCLTRILPVGDVFLPYSVKTLGVVTGVFCDGLAFYKGIFEV